jgi:hypothetical protein
MRMRKIEIQPDAALADVMEEWVAHLLVAIPVGEPGLKFDGGLSNGTVVNHRKPQTWTVSFRRNPGQTDLGHYRNPHAAARAIIEQVHNEEKNLT